MSNYYPENARVYETKIACQWGQTYVHPGMLLVTNKPVAEDHWKLQGAAKGFDFRPYGERVLADCEWTQEDNYLAGIHRANVELAEAKDSESPRRISEAHAALKKAEHALHQFQGKKN